MPNRIVTLALFLCLPMLAYAKEMHATAIIGRFTFYYGLLVLVPALLIYIIAILYCSKKGYYRSQAFTSKYLIAVLLIPIIGIALALVEYLLDMSATGMHIGTLVSILFVYGLMSLIFAIPYILYLSAATKSK
jgi:uncharacterized membrane protein YhaH (DUF805 family)